MRICSEWTYGGMQVRIMLCPVQDLQVVVFEITTPNFGFSTASTLGRSIFLVLKKNFKKEKKIQKTLKKQGFSLKKDAVCNGFSISLAF